MEADIRGAVRAVCSSNGLAPFSSETLTALQEKHPPAPADLNFPLTLEEGVQLTREIFARLLILSNQDRLQGQMVSGQVIVSKA